MYLEIEKNVKCYCCNKRDADKMDLELYELHKIKYFSCAPCRWIMWGED